MWQVGDVWPQNVPTITNENKLLSDAARCRTVIIRFSSRVSDAPFIPGAVSTPLDLVLADRNQTTTALTDQNRATRHRENERKPVEICRRDCRTTRGSERRPAPASEAREINFENFSVDMAHERALGRNAEKVALTR
jgi:hypothetical protein